MAYRGVVFDLDGTLLDTLDDLADSMNAVLSSLGHPTHRVDAYRYFVGEGVSKLIQRALPPDHRAYGPEGTEQRTEDITHRIVPLQLVSPLPLHFRRDLRQVSGFGCQGTHRVCQNARGRLLIIIQPPAH